MSELNPGVAPLETSGPTEVDLNNQRDGETLGEWVKRCGIRSVERILMGERQRYGVSELGTAQAATPSPKCAGENCYRFIYDDRTVHVAPCPLSSPAYTLTATPVETASPDESFDEWESVQESGSNRTYASAHRSHAKTAYLDGWKALESQLTQVQAKYSKAMRALESLTPSGSEFVGDVDNCVAHVRQRQESQHKVIVSFSNRAKSAELELTQVREELRQERSIKEAEKKILLAEIETSTRLRSALDASADNNTTLLAELEQVTRELSRYRFSMELNLGKAEAENKTRGEALESIIAEADESNGGKGSRLPIVLHIRELAEAALHSSTPKESNGPKE